MLLVYFFHMQINQGLIKQMTQDLAGPSGIIIHKWLQIKKDWGYLLLRLISDFLIAEMGLFISLCIISTILN